MYTLSFDTTGSACGIILQNENQTISKFEHMMDFGQAEVLIPQIKQMLEGAGLSFKELGAVFVCVGPGSFTGVRSSISAAKVFKLAVPSLILSGVSAFDAYIQSFDESEIAEKNAVIIETRREDFYVQIFDKHLKKATTPAAMLHDDIIALLKGRLVSLVGDGVERFLSTPSGLNIHAIKMFDYLPVELLAAAGKQALSAKMINFPKPLYLRSPDVTLPSH